MSYIENRTGVALAALVPAPQRAVGLAIALGGVALAIARLV